MKTWTGSNAPLQPGVGEMNMLDLVVHMGRERRWGGWGSQEWTVLHHTTLVSLIWLRAGFPREGLAYIFVHDQHEYVTGDLPSPVKRLLGDKIKELETHLDNEVRAYLGGMPPATPEIRRMVKLCDFAALTIEAPLFGPPGSADGETATALKVADPNPEVAALQEDVRKLVAQVLPEFELILQRRATVGNR